MRLLRQRSYLLATSISVEKVRKENYCYAQREKHQVKLQKFEV
jgi:hypothetical protein